MALLQKTTVGSRSSDVIYNSDGAQPTPTTEHQRPPLSCLLHVLWIITFCGIMCGGGVLATFRHDGPRIMFTLVMALFLASLALPSYAHEGSVVAACFMFMLIPLGPLNDYSFGTEACTWIVASALVTVIFQTRTLLLLLLQMRRNSNMALPSSRYSSSPWGDAMSFLLLTVALVVPAAILFWPAVTGSHENSGVASIPPTFTWRLVATLACLCLILLLVAIKVAPWLIMTTLECEDNEVTEAANRRGITTQILYATLTLASMVNMLTSLLAFFPSDVSMLSAFASFLLSVAAAYVLLNHGNHYLAHFGCQPAALTPGSWNAGKVYLEQGENNQSTILHSGRFAPRTQRQHNQFLVVVVFWVSALIVTPVYTLAVTFVLRAYQQTDESHPVVDSMAAWLCCTVFAAVVFLFPICWKPLRYNVVQANDTSDIALVVECVGATYVYDHVHQVYQGSIPSHIQSQRSYCTNDTSLQSVVVVTTNHHIQLTPHDPDTLIRAITSAVARQQQHQDDSVELTAPRETHFDTAPLLHSNDGGRNSSNRAQNQTLWAFLKLQHPVKLFLLVAWVGAIVCSIVLWAFVGHCHPMLSLGLDLTLLGSSIFFLAPLAMAISVMVACFLFLKVGWGEGGDRESGDAGSKHSLSYGEGWWMVIAANILFLLCFQGMLLSRLSVRSSSSLDISPTPVAKWTMLPMAVAITSLLLAHSIRIMWLLLAVLAGTTIIVLVVVLIPWVVWTIVVCSERSLLENKTTRKLLYATVTVACMADLSLSILAFFPSYLSMPCALGSMVLSFAATCVSFHSCEGYCDGQRSLLYGGFPTPRTRAHTVVTTIMTMIWVASLLVTPLATVSALFVRQTRDDDNKRFEPLSIWLSVATIFVMILFLGIMERPVKYNVVKSEETSVIALVVECVGATYLYDRVTQVYKGSIPSHVAKRNYHVTKLGVIDGVVVVTANNHVMINPEDVEAFVSALEMAICHSDDA